MEASAVSAGSEPVAAPSAPQIRLTFHIVTAGVLLAALVALHAGFELTRPAKVLTEGALALPPRPASDGTADVEELARGVFFTPELAVDGPTTLVIELERGAMEGWVGAQVSLLHRDSGEVRQLSLGSSFVRGPDGRATGALSSRARVGEVESGTWIARLEPAWEPIDPAAEAPHAMLRIRQERRSPVHFWGAAGLVVAPALVQVARRVWYTRRAKAVGTPQTIRRNG